ncbi:hypothetical protein LIER_17927 [Lithospermum erythrorhizon]|uniref:Retroviral polymerase SH3-like domain-containing protein n=1 Tax=Lithospermum erythrorhizon TaxID=34254 RepID=A0AAV3QEP7_LITER
MLRDVGLEKSLWAEAVNIACYVINRSPSTTIELKTPIEMWNGKKPDYSRLHIFGSHVYVMYNAQEITKLDPKSRKYFFLGYADGVKGSRLWDPTPPQDDMLVAGPNKDRVKELKAQMAKEFEMKDLGPENMILGMQIYRDRKIWVS